MDLESLKLAMDEAKAKATASPKDESLQSAFIAAEKAYNDAKAAADADHTGDGGEGDSENLDESKLDEKTKKYLAKLRKENASHRTKSKDYKSKLEESETRRKAILKAAGINDDERSPEEKLAALEAEKQTQAFRSAILESAIQHGITADQVEYYEFLVTKATNALTEGEELSEEKLVEIVSSVKKAGGKSANSTVGGGDGKGGSGSSPAPGGSGAMTLEKFCSLSIVEKSKLYTDNPSLYEELMKTARAKKKLV